MFDEVADIWRATYSIEGNNLTKKRPRDWSNLTIMQSFTPQQQLSHPSSNVKKVLHVIPIPVPRSGVKQSDVFTPHREVMSSSKFTYVSPSTNSYLTPAEAASRSRAAVAPLQPPEPSVEQPDDPPTPTLDVTQPVQLTSPTQVFPSIHSLPKVVWHLNPAVKLKLRKRFYPLGVTRLTLGADYDIRSRHLSFKWSWYDRIIGGRLEFDADQIALTKRFDVDKSTKLDLRAAFDIHARRTLFSLSVKPFWGIWANDRPPPGLSIKQKIPVDRHLAVEVAGRLSMPEARFSNETPSALSLGEGDFVFDLDQLNFRFMLK